MAYYLDLSQYQHNTVKGGDPAKILNVGWLSHDHKFETAAPAEWLVEKLWAHCLYSVEDAYGFHQCDLHKCTWRKRRRCQVSGPQYLPYREVRATYARGSTPHPDYATAEDYIKALNSNKIYYSKTIITVTRSRRKEPLGYSEIRIMGENDIVYAAPNLIFHYVIDHHYKMPDEVIAALKHGPCPPEQEYFDRLRLTGVRLSRTQCFQRFERARLPKREMVISILDIPAGPVPWIPEMKSRAVGRVPRPGAKP